MGCDYYEYQYIIYYFTNDTYEKILANTNKIYIGYPYSYVSEDIDSYIIYENGKYTEDKYMINGLVLDYNIDSNISKIVYMYEIKSRL